MIFMILKLNYVLNSYLKYNLFMSYGINKFENIGEIMKLIEIKTRDFNDPLFAFGHESHMLVETVIDKDSPLCERFNDTRTPYEQYCAGEKYLKYNEDTLYSRYAHEYMFDMAERRNTMFQMKNYKLNKNCKMD